MADFTHKSVDDVKDSAPEFGFGEHQEARFATEALDAEQTGLSFHRIKPGMRQGFAHTHDETEEVYFVAGGSGRMKIDDEVIDLAPAGVRPDRPRRRPPVRGGRRRPRDRRLRQAQPRRQGRDLPRLVERLSGT